MATNLAAQLDALVELSVDYWGARDLTWGVLSRAFGDPLPPLSQCVWPPSGITEQEANFRLRSVRDFLQQWGSGHIRGVIREIRKAQEGLVASGFDPPDSWIIANPLEDLMGGAMGLCGVREIVRSVPAEHAALEKVRGEVEVALIRLRGKIAGRQVGAKSEQGEAATATGSTAPADQTKRGEGTSGADSTPKVEGGNAGSTPAKRSRKGVGGKPRLSKEEEQRRLEIVNDWEQAQSAGVKRKDFCDDKGIKLKDLRTCVNWHGTRKSRATNSE